MRWCPKIDKYQVWSYFRLNNANAMVWFSLNEIKKLMRNKTLKFIYVHKEPLEVNILLQFLEDGIGKRRDF